MIICIYCSIFFPFIALIFFQVEKIFRKSVEFCNESDTWKLNVAHVLFMVGDIFSINKELLNDNFIITKKVGSKYYLNVH
jgi:hypothetical protein